VIDEILRLVPNVDVFRDALRCIKFWAQRTWYCCLVAPYLVILLRESHIFKCKRFSRWRGLGAPCCSDMSIIPKCYCWCHSQQIFHHLLSMVCYRFGQFTFPDHSLTWWNRSWPQPVLLKQIEDGPLQVRVWNPKVEVEYTYFSSFNRVFQLYPSDRAHRMPIITPAYPAMCATHNVTASTQMIITEEFKRGSALFLATYRLSKRRDRCRHCRPCYRWHSRVVRAICKA